jgi:hypothetical protein
MQGDLATALLEFLPDPHGRVVPSIFGIRRKVGMVPSVVVKGSLCLEITVICISPPPPSQSIVREARANWTLYGRISGSGCVR